MTCARRRCELAHGLACACGGVRRERASVPRVIVTWGSVPTWVVAGAAVGAFGAASRAAMWTARSAAAGREQVKAAIDQVEAARQQAVAARGQLDLAKSGAVRDQEAARAAEDRLLHAQLDARAPVVYARATPGSADRPALSAVTESEYEASPESLTDPGNAVREQRTLDEGEHLRFALTVTIEFVNCSDVPARINITAHRNADVTLPRGQELLVPPHESRLVVWTRRFGSRLLSAQVDLDRPDLTMFQIDYLVRDLSHNVSDTYRFNSGLRYFNRVDGRLVVEPQPAFPWTEDFATQVGERRYERLEGKASVQAIKALHGSE